MCEKNLLLLLLLVSCIIKSTCAQSVFEINIESTTKATFTAKNGSNSVQFGDLTFSNGTGKLIITNATNTNQYKISFTVGDADQNFLIPVGKIPVAASGTPGKVTFNIKADGTNADIANSMFSPRAKLNITVQDAEGTTLGTFSQEGTTEPRTSSSHTDAKIQDALHQYVEERIAAKGYRYISSQNIIIDAFGIVHLYLDENLSPIYSYFPTTAKDGYDKFMFHVLSTKEFTYTVESNGKFDPTPISDDIQTNGFPKIQSTGKKQIFEFPSAIFGPFTGNFPFLIQRYKEGVPDKSIDRSVKLIKVSRVSLNVGMVATSLKNPENITKQPLPSGDSTLIADNPNVRGLLVAILTFHFKPRNLSIPPRTFNERWGVSVGVGLTEKLGKNFFFGLNLEVVNGLFLNGGAHFGEVNYPFDYKDFEYGKQTYTGSLVTKKRWDVKPYVCVSIDAALFTKAFSSLFNSSTPAIP